VPGKAPIANFVMFISRCADFNQLALANYVFGVRAWHILHGLRWAMEDMRVKACPWMVPLPLRSSSKDGPLNETFHHLSLEKTF